MYVVGVAVGTARVTARAASCTPGSAPPLPGSAPPLSGALSMIYQQAESLCATAYVADDRRILVGDEAEQLGLEHPQNIVRHAVRRIGDAVPIVTDNGCVSAESVVAALIAQLVERIVAQHGCRPAQMCVAYPASWGPYKRDLLESALHPMCLPETFLIADAAAAASHHLATDLPNAGVVAVYDLGASSADATVVGRRNGELGVVGHPQVADHVGGDTFDDVLFRHLCDELGLRTFDGSTPGMRDAVRTLRRHCIAAKETLSVDTDAMISVSLPRMCTRVRVVRSEFEDAIRDTVQDGVDPLLEGIKLAGFQAADIDAVLLVGGSCRIPLVVQSISAALRRPISVDECPETSIATGAARMAGARAAEILLRQPTPQELRPDDGRPQPTQDVTQQAAPSPVHPPQPVDPATEGTAPTDGPKRHRNQRSGRWVSRARRVPTQAEVKRQALVTAMLATALFATSSIAAPQLVESGRDRDTGTTKPGAFSEPGADTEDQVGGPAAAPSAPDGHDMAALQAVNRLGRHH